MAFFVLQYSKSSGYNGPDLRCFEITNALHKNINDNTVQCCNIEALKLDHCDQEIQCFGLICFRHLHRKVVQSNMEQYFKKVERPAPFTSAASITTEPLPSTSAASTTPTSPPSY